MQSATTNRLPEPRFAFIVALHHIVEARSSVGEHYLDTVGVGGSIPPVPTRLFGFYGYTPTIRPSDS